MKDHRQFNIKGGFGEVICLHCSYIYVVYPDDRACPFLSCPKCGTEQKNPYFVKPKERKHAAHPQV